MHPLIPAIAFFALCAVLGDALKAFGMDFVDLIVMTAVWIALPIFVLDRIAPPKFQAWATRRTETESAWLMLAPPFAVAVVGWYLVDWHSGPFSRMHGFTAFCVLYYLSVPVGLGLMVLLGPELLDDSHRTVGSSGGGGGSGARPMGPRDYGGMTIDQTPARSPADEKAFAFDPARFGKTGSVQSSAPQPERSSLILASVDRPSESHLIVDMGFSRVYELGADSFLVVTEGERDTIMNRRQFTAKTGCCIDDLRGHWSFGRDADAVKRKNAVSGAKAR